ncbi:hypothetical protein C1646_534417 [Rhizophagus diaphanus]|nr:hypothetical protein C1646_534417 [Rhizophagus diaphanus] [Rhizophagus sp. MUCL 43196]
MSCNHESEVVKNLERLLNTDTNYDVIIYVGDFKEFHAHSNILSCRSEYFNKILSSNDIDKKDGKYIIKEINITPQTFEVIIKYLYTGHADITKKTGIEILNIMIASDDLKLNQLIKPIEDFLIENHHQFLRDDPIEILQTIFYRQEFNNLQEFCLEMICYEPEILFNSSKFIYLPAPILEIILKRDDLNLDEIEIWENLIKWGLAQDSILNDDNTGKDFHEKFDSFKRILHKFIPLIRFNEISHDNYLIKVKPYEEILPKELQEKILKFYTTSELTFDNKPRYSKSVIDSFIINQNHIILLTNWIDKKEENSKYIKAIPYDFNLLYRASRDGYTATAFHEKCDNKGATIIIAKIKDSEQIIGGYNPLYWDSNKSWMSTKDSFIFSLTNKNDDLESIKIGYSNGDDYSIVCFPFDGPRFGGGNDLVYSYSNSWTSNPYSYPNIGLSSNFNVVDYEVFQVIKKLKKNTLKNTKINHILLNLNNEGIGNDQTNKDKSFDKEILIF